MPICQILPVKKNAIGFLLTVSLWDISGDLFYLHSIWSCFCFTKTLGFQKACRSASTWHLLGFGGWLSQLSLGDDFAHATLRMKSHQVKICLVLLLSNSPKPWKCRQSQSRSICFLLY